MNNTEEMKLLSKSVQAPLLFIKDYWVENVELPRRSAKAPSRSVADARSRLIETGLQRKGFNRVGHSQEQPVHGEVHTIITLGANPQCREATWDGYFCWWRVSIGVLFFPGTLAPWQDEIPRAAWWKLKASPE